MRALTSRQAAVLDFIKNYIDKYNYSPTTREIAEHFGFSIKAAHDHITALYKKKVINKVEGRARTIEVVSSIPQDKCVVPHISPEYQGRAFNLDNLNVLLVPAHLVASEGRHYALTVMDDSMKGCGILEGDIVIVNSEAAVEEGCLVVTTNGEHFIYVRHYYGAKNKAGIRMELRPENEEFNSTFVTDPDLILGVVVGLIRRYI